MIVAGVTLWAYRERILAPMAVDRETGRVAAAVMSRSESTETGAEGTPTETPEDRENDSVKMVAAWVRTDPTATLRWIERQPEGLLRDRLTAVGALVLADRDPALAMQWAVNFIAVDELMDDVVLRIFEKWATQRPAEAAQMADLLPEGALREQAADRVAQRWLRSNPMPAYIWMKSSAESERLIANLSEQP